MSEPDNDGDLQRQFGQTHAQLRAEPFVTATAHRIATLRTQRLLLRRVLQGLGLGALILLSPWLIRGSVAVSDQFDVQLGATTNWLLTPLGAAAGIAAVGIVVAIALLLRAVTRPDN